MVVPMLSATRTSLSNCRFRPRFSAESRGGMTRSPADADDLVQDVLERAWRGRRSFRAESALSTWLYRIAINRARDLAARADSARTVPSGIDDIDLPVSRLDHPEVLAESLADEQTVRAALATLSVEDRMVLALHDGEGWTAPRISTVCELTVASVYKRIHRARIRLLRALPGVSASESVDSELCRKTLVHASAYLDGHLDVETSTRIDEHLRQCPRCPPIAGALVGIKTALGQRPWSSAMPPDFVRAVDTLGNTNR